MTTATIQVEPIPAFFQALASYAASSKRGKKALAEVASMLSDHRIVRVPIWSGHATCVARVDMPDYGISAGELFQLFESGYSDEQGGSYAYIVADECSCKSYEFRYQCTHRTDASKYNLARYQAQWHKEDEPVHVAESIEEGDFEIELPIVLLDADGEMAMVLRYGSEFCMRVNELGELGEYEEVYTLADFEEAKAERMQLTHFGEEASELVEQLKRDEAEAHLTERQRQSLATMRHVLAMSAKEREWRAAKQAKEYSDPSEPVPPPLGRQEREWEIVGEHLVPIR